MSCISLAGWLSGVFNAVKLLYSFSTSGPSSTLKPISEKIDEISSIVCDTGCIFPRTKVLSGRVISTFSFSNFLFISSIWISSILEFIRFCNSFFIKFKSEANFFLSFSAIDPNFLNSDEINPLFTYWLDLISFISDKFNFYSNFKRNSPLIFLRSDILTDYFLTKIKQ